MDSFCWASSSFLKKFCLRILFHGLPLPSIAHRPIWSRVGSDTTYNDPAQVQTNGLKSSIQKWLTKLNIFKRILTYILDLTPVDIRCGTIPWDITFYPPFRIFRPRNSLGFPGFLHPILIEPEFCPRILFPGLPLPSLAHHPIWSRVGSDTTDQYRSISLIRRISINNKAIHTMC